HRVVSGLANFNIREFAQKAKKYFEVEELSSSLSPAELLAKLNETDGVAFVAAARDGNLLLKPKADAIAPLLAGLSLRQQRLDVTQLHKIILEKILGLDEETIRKGEGICYSRAGE